MEAEEEEGNLESLLRSAAATCPVVLLSSMSSLLDLWRLPPPPGALEECCRMGGTGMVRWPSWSVSSAGSSLMLLGELSPEPEREWNI